MYKTKRNLHFAQISVKSIEKHDLKFELPIQKELIEFTHRKRPILAIRPIRLRPLSFRASKISPQPVELSAGMLQI